MPVMEMLCYMRVSFEPAIHSPKFSVVVAVEEIVLDVLLVVVGRVELDWNLKKCSDLAAPEIWKLRSEDLLLLWIDHNPFPIFPSLDLVGVG